MSVVYQSLTRHEKNYNIRFVLHRNLALYWGNMDQNQTYRVAQKKICAS